MGHGANCANHDVKFFSFLPFQGRRVLCRHSPPVFFAQIPSLTHKTNLSEISQCMRCKLYRSPRPAEVAGTIPRDGAVPVGHKAQQKVGD